MNLTFTKMNGCGNDYIYCSGVNLPDPSNLAIKLTNRNTSIGGDGLVLITESYRADAKMQMFNADGSEGLMCGNSIRCVGKYLYDQGIVKRLNMTIETASGVKPLTLIVEDGEVTKACVNMGKPILAPGEIPVDFTGDMVVARQVAIGGKPYEITCLSMGNPHAVIFNQDLAHANLQATGAAFEKSSLFPAGVNLSIVQTVTRKSLKMRVWERGSGETKSSGTGACAAAVAAVLMGYADKNTEIQIQLEGGLLTVKYTDDAVYLTGDCATSYEGVVRI